MSSKTTNAFQNESNFVNVRKCYFLWSDRVNGIRCNALPSGHVRVMTTVWIAALLEGIPLFTIFLPLIWLLRAS